MSATEGRTPTASRAPRVREAALPQLPRLAVALGMSLLLWLYVASIGEPANRTRYPRVPIEVRNVRENLILSRDPPGVSIEVRALPGASLGATAGVPSAYIDLAGRGPGAHLAPVRVEEVDGAEVVNVQPRQVRVQLEPTRSAVLPVRLSPTVRGPAAASLTRAVVQPAQVTVEGSQGELQRVAQVRADVDPRALAPGTQQAAPLLAVDAAGRAVDTVRLVPSQVVVTLPPAATATP